MKKYFLLFFTLYCLTSYISKAQSTLWGMATYGGADGVGVIFSMPTGSTSLNVRYSFPTCNCGNNPQGSLLAASNGKLYGLANTGLYVKGQIFSFDTVTNTYKDEYDIPRSWGGMSSSNNIYANLIQTSNGMMYGMTEEGGLGGGNIFSFNPVNDSATDLHDFNTSLFGDGSHPYGSLLQAYDSNLYGMTYEGGDSGAGTIFSYDINTNIETVVYSLKASTGYGPYGNLIQAKDSTLYGLTQYGGKYGLYGGTLFSYNIKSGLYSMLVQFNDTGNGENPEGSLVQATNGKLYGMTRHGGHKNDGTLFSYNPTSQQFTALIEFNDMNGGNPLNESSPMQASNGKLYGMTLYGGTDDYGVVYEYDITTSTYTIKTSFDNTNGLDPTGSLIELGTSSASVPKINTSNNFCTVYPNPSTGIFTISFAGAQNFMPSTIEIYNVLGEKVYSNSYQPLANSYQLKTIDLSLQANGIYLYRVIAQHGNLIGEGKVVIQK
jgi:uncharacterized repeat protein (TIGR03803 family)